MKKVLIIQSVLPEYRIPIFNELAEKYDVTVMISKQPKTIEDIKFTVDVVPEIHIPKMGRYFKCNIFKKINKYDVCISMLTTNYLQIVTKLFFKLKTKMIMWGIGVSAGYGIPYDSNAEYGKKLFKIIEKADAALFYSDYPLKKYAPLGISEEKMFVANNTVKVIETDFNDRRSDYFLFVGTLYPAKGVDILLKEYYEAYKENNSIADLVIVGDGSEREKCEEFCKSCGLTEKVRMLGAIYDETKLKDLFRDAIACISPNQAGLSVLKAMGYGVAFVTSEDSITGGERFNISNRENGVLYKEDSELKDIILDADKNKEKYMLYGKNAKDYYENNRTAKQMSEGFCKAIEYVLKEN